MLKKKRKLILGFLIGAYFFITLSVFAAGVSRIQVASRMSEEKANLGIQAVKLLYDFGTPEQLDYQMRSLKEIVTEPVFNQLTIDNEERTLATYLKFKNESTSVNVIKATDSYILYSLSNSNIESSRKFLFLFNVKNGVIDSVREMEAIDFIEIVD